MIKFHKGHEQIDDSPELGAVRIEAFYDTEEAFDSDSVTASMRARIEDLLRETAEQRSEIESLKRKLGKAEMAKAISATSEIEEATKKLSEEFRVRAEQVAQKTQDRKCLHCGRFVFKIK